MESFDYVLIIIMIEETREINISRGVRKMDYTLHILQISYYTFIYAFHCSF